MMADLRKKWHLFRLIGHEMFGKGTCRLMLCISPATASWKMIIITSWFAKLKYLEKSNTSLAVSQEKGKRCWLELLRSKNITGDKQLVTGTTVWAQDSKELGNRLTICAKLIHIKIPAILFMPVNFISLKWPYLFTRKIQLQKRHVMQRKLLIAPLAINTLSLLPVLALVGKSLHKSVGG